METFIFQIANPHKLFWSTIYDNGQNENQDNGMKFHIRVSLPTKTSSRKEGPVWFDNLSMYPDFQPCKDATKDPKRYRPRPMTTQFGSVSICFIGSADKNKFWFPEKKGNSQRPTWDLHIAQGLGSIRIPLITQNHAKYIFCHITCLSYRFEIWYSPEKFRQYWKFLTTILVSTIFYDDTSYCMLNGPQRTVSV